ncbi:MAG: hypothetical protein JRI72_15765 [Deltaproteobacteria bacterium]|nr:hypothetical protein [Deltaproteobacteria bacterium]
MMERKIGWIWYKGKFRPFLKYEKKKKTVKVLLNGRMRTVKEKRIKVYPGENNGNTDTG